MLKLSFVYTLLMVSIFSSNQALSASIIPFHTIDGYIMIKGDINGNGGKFMFDTGTPFRFFFNNNKVDVRSDKFLASGRAGSGQPISIYKQSSPVLVNIFYGLINTICSDVKHTDFEFIQKSISSDFLGMIGKGFIEDRRFSIDYEAQEIIVYDKTEKIDLGNNHINVHINKNQLPEAEVDIGGLSIVGYFDTGNLGSLTLTKDTARMLANTGNLKIAPSSSSHGEPMTIQVASIAKAMHKQQALGTISQLYYNTGTENRIALGYSFLKNFKSIWDISAGNIYLLPK